MHRQIVALNPSGIRIVKRRNLNRMTAPDQRAAQSRHRRRNTTDARLEGRDYLKNLHLNNEALRSLKVCVIRRQFLDRRGGNTSIKSILFRERMVQKRFGAEDGIIR